MKNAHQPQTEVSNMCTQSFDDATHSCIITPSDPTYSVAMAFAQSTYRKRHGIEIDPHPSFISAATEDNEIVGLLAVYIAHDSRLLFSERLMDSRQRMLLLTKTTNRSSLCEVGTRCISQDAQMSAINISCLLMSQVILEAIKRDINYLFFTSNRTICRVIRSMGGVVEQIDELYSHEGNEEVVTEWHSIFKARHYFFLVDTQRNAANAQDTILRLTQKRPK